MYERSRRSNVDGVTIQFRVLSVVGKRSCRVETGSLDLLGLGNR